MAVVRVIRTRREPVLQEEIVNVSPPPVSGDDRGSETVRKPIFGGITSAESAVATLALLDIVATTLAAVIAKFGYLDLLMDSHPSSIPYLALAFALAPVACLLFYLIGLYDFEVLTGPLIGVGKILAGLALAFLVILGALFLGKISDGFSRIWLLSWFATNATGLVVFRFLLSRHICNQMRAGLLRHRIALFGTMDYVRRLQEQLRAAMPFSEIVGVQSDPLGHTAAAQARVPDALHDILVKGECDLVILAFPSSAALEIKSAIQALTSYSTELCLCTDLATRSIPIAGSLMLGDTRMDIINTVPSSERTPFIKRGFDSFIAALAIMVLAPVFLIIAVAVKLDSPGPVFFRQRRYGQNNNIFQIFKFRTMTVTEDGDVVTQATRNDVRVTRTGRFLRSSSLDELPQLFNVLLGEMSMVGPRPHAVAHDQFYEKKFDQFSRRRRVRPGLTGWAQVNGWRGEIITPDAMRRRMEHDLFYVDNWSIWFDLEILVRTVFVLTRNAY